MLDQSGVGNILEETHGYIYDSASATPTLLGTLPGDTASRAIDVNDRGQAVGTFGHLTSSLHATSYVPREAFLESDGQMTDLGMASVSAINNLGQIVGGKYLWDHGTLTDLNTLIDPSSGWVITSTADINDAGQIVGQGTLNGLPQSLLLEPGVRKVTNTNDSGVGSLRQATLDANELQGNIHTIEFDLAGTQLHLIPLLSPLPTAAYSATLSLDATQNAKVVLPAGAAWIENRPLTISGGGSLEIDGGIEGTGDLSVNLGGLTVSHIIEDALVIGGTASSPSLVTIAVSDGSGNIATSAAAVLDLTAQPATISSAPASTSPFITTSSDRTTALPSHGSVVERQAAGTLQPSGFVDLWANGPLPAIPTGSHAALPPPVLALLPERSDLARPITIAVPPHPNAVAALIGDSHNWLWSADDELRLQTSESGDALTLNDILRLSTDNLSL
jgi:hypothetical protein